MKHTHHITPRYMGGTDDPSNLIEVSLEQHAELHFALYLEHGKVEDWVACQSLAGLITHEEARRLAAAQSNRDRVWTEEMRNNAARGSKGNSNAKGHSPSEEIRKQWSVKRKGRKWWNNGVEETLAFECPDGWVKGRANNPAKWLKRDEKGRIN